jgi:hypothetical protein
MFNRNHIRLAGRGLICAAVGVLAASCASHPWRQDSNVTAGRWETSPDAVASSDTIPPRNELIYTAAPAPAPAPAAPMIVRKTNLSTTKPVRATTVAPRPVPQKAELTGLVTIGSEGSKFGSPGSAAHMDWYAGNGKGTVTVVVEVETPVNLDNEHLDLRLERLDSRGRPIASSAMVRQTGMIAGEKMTYELTTKPGGKVRLTAAGVESNGGKPGFQSRWTVRVVRFRSN